MGISVLGAGPSGWQASTAVASTQYFSLGQDGIAATASNDTNEAHHQIPFNAAATFSNWGITLFDNTSSQTVVVALRDGGATVNETVSFAAGINGTSQDTTHTDSILSGDLINGINSTASNGKGYITSQVAVQAVTSSSPATICASQTGLAFTTASTTGYFPLVADGSITTTGETAADNTLALTAGTLSNFLAYIQTNGNTNTATMVVRINAANGTGTLSIGAGVTGALTDATHTDSVLATDAFNGALTTGSGTVSILASPRSVFFTGSGGLTPVFAGSTGLTGTSYANYYVGSFGAANASLTESTQQTIWAAGATLSSLSMLLGVYSSGATPVLTLRIGGANGNQTLSPAVGTGWTQDLTHTDSAASGALVNYGFGSSTAAIAPTKFAMIYNAAISTNLSGVQGTGAAGTVIGGVEPSTFGIAATAAARAVAASPSAGLTGVAATSAAGTVTAVPAAGSGQAAAHSAAGVFSTDVQPQLTGARATATAGVAIAGPFPAEAAATGAAHAPSIVIYIPPVSSAALRSIMRNSPAAASGAMGNTPIALIEALYPDGPQPRSLDIALAGVQGTALAATIQRGYVWNGYAPHITATGVARALSVTTTDRFIHPTGIAASATVGAVTVTIA